MADASESLKTILNRRNSRKKTADLGSYVFDKVQPQARDLEEAVLGGMMLDKNAVAEVIDILKPDSFYVEAHQHIFQAIHDLFAKSQPVDILTVTEQLRKNGQLTAVGGPYYVTQLTNRVGSTANIEHHARIISEKYILRELIQTSNKIIKDAYEETTDVFELLNQAEQELFGITENNIRRSYDSMNNLVSQAIKQLEAIKDHEEGVTGIPSGFTDLDRFTSGWHRSDLVILAARPGMGKCLGKDTKVVMYDGTLKKVQNIQVGDLLMGDDSTPRTVLSLARGRERMYWVRQNKGIDYRVNESHILSLKNNKQEVINLNVLDYLQQKSATHYKGYKKTIDFPARTTAISPYNFGCWLVDNIAPKTQEAELKLLNTFEKKHIPLAYISNCIEYRISLLRGLLTKNNATITNGVYKIVDHNHDFLQQIKFLADTLGLYTELDSTTSSLTIIGHLNQISTIQTADWQLSDITVEFDKVDDYYGFEIDGNHLFLLEDMTVTHNTSFALSVARNVAVDFNRGVAVFSLEMSKLQLVNRLISAETGISGDKLKRGNLAPHEWVELTTKVDRLSEAPIFIDDTPAINIFELRAKCRRLKMQHDIQLIVIDYLQLMSGGGTDKRSGGNREQEISMISRSLKSIAKELDVPVIALSQLSRAVETRGGDKRPMLSDLRESGSIEQDADIVVFLYRPEYYGFDQDDEGNPTQGVGEIMISKHRNGPTGTVKVKFVANNAKFEDLDTTSQEFEDLPNLNDIITIPSKGNDMGASEDAPF